MPYRKINGQNHIPVVVLTAKDDERSKISGFAKGAVQYLAKPFNMEELKTRLRTLLQQRERLCEKICREVLLEPAVVQVADPNSRFLEKSSFHH